MIVADTNIISYLLVSGERTAEAQKALQRDRLWAAPYLWRSEFCNVMTVYVRKQIFSWNDAHNNLNHALRLMHGKEYAVPPKRLLELAASSNCTAYDCEFVALAQDLGIKLVTVDRQILAEFPETAIDLSEFAGN